MAYKNLTIGRVPSLLYTRRSDNTVTSVDESSTYTTYQLVTTGQHTDTLRRAFPSDLWAGGTGRTFSEFRRVMHGVGYQHISERQWRVALPNRWWAGSGTTNLNSVHGIDLSGALRAKIKDQNVNLAQALGEYRQTANLFSRAASDVWHLFHATRQGKGLKQLKRMFNPQSAAYDRQVAQQWLRYQYGFKPVFNDIYASCEELNKKLFEGVWVYVRVRGKEYKSGLAVWPDAKTRAGESSWSITHNLTLQARYMIADSSVKQLSQVGISNPLHAAWELIPYSFIVDWLLPVGQWLSSLDALNGTKNLSFYEVLHSRGAEHGSTYGGGFTNEFNFYSRNGPKTTIPMPRLRYQPSDSLTKIVNGLALLRNLQVDKR